jgi:hypothetical protein
MGGEASLAFLQIPDGASKSPSIGGLGGCFSHQANNFLFSYLQHGILDFCGLSKLQIGI